VRIISTPWTGVACRTEKRARVSRGRPGFDLDQVSLTRIVFRFLDAIEGRTWAFLPASGSSAIKRKFSGRRAKLLSLCVLRPGRMLRPCILPSHAADPVS
jgi:hypothetical protein